MTSVDDVGGRTDFAGIQALSSRSAGYAVAQKCLEVQAEAEAKDPSLKTATAVRLAPDAWSWYMGAVGEMEVGRLLSALGPEWFVRHAVPIGAGTKDVDHLVIGPAGVFAINTKNHGGATIGVSDYVLWANGKQTHHLGNAQRDGAQVAKRLDTKVQFPVAVTSVVAVINAKSVSDRRAFDNRLVQVISAHALVEWLQAQPRVFDEAVLELIELAAEEPETWHMDPHAADTLRVMSRFERLVTEVGTPAAPHKKADRPRSTAIRRAATTRPRQSASRAAGRPAKKTSFSDLLKLWLATIIIIFGLLMLRGYADQPCTSAIGCVGSSLYMAVKPLLILLGVGAITVGFVGTIVMVARLAGR
jgi:hypothetical protein